MSKTLWLCIIGTGFVVIVSTATAAAQQAVASPSSPGELERIIATLTWWVTILGIFATVVITASALNIVNQIYQARKFADSTKSELRAEVQRDLHELKEAYQLSALKPPQEILNEARREYDPLIEALRGTVQRFYSELEAKITQVTAENERRRNEVEEALLRKVLNAFIQVKNLSDEERRAVAEALKAAA